MLKILACWDKWSARSWATEVAERRADEQTGLVGGNIPDDVSERESKVILEKHDEENKEIYQELIVLKG